MKRKNPQQGTRAQIANMKLICLGKNKTLENFVPLTMSDLVEEMPKKKTKQAAQDLVRRLEAKGWVSREYRNTEKNRVEAFIVPTTLGFQVIFTSAVSAGSEVGSDLEAIEFELED